MLLPPLVPALGSLRLASPNDVLRIGIVAACGFCYSPLFAWERPYHEKYPADTVLSYRQQVLTQIQDPNMIVLVAVDKYDPAEADKSKAIIPDDDLWEAPAAGEEVIVGWVSYKLEVGSKRVGQLKKNTGNSHDLYELCGILPLQALTLRYLPIKIVTKIPIMWSDGVRSLKQDWKSKYLQNASEMYMLAVHPAYWRKGYGTALVKFGLELARIDRVRQGLVAAEMGKRLYFKLGYSAIGSISVEGDDEHPDGVKLLVMDYDPESRFEM